AVDGGGKTRFFSPLQFNPRRGLNCKAQNPWEEPCLTNLAVGRGRERPHTRALSDKVEAIKIHHLVPRSDKVTHELLLRVVTRIDLREGSELGVRAEDKVDGGGGPLELARGAIMTLVHVLSRG